MPVTWGSFPYWQTNFCSLGVCCFHFIFYFCFLFLLHVLLPGEKSVVPRARANSPSQHLGKRRGWGSALLCCVLITSLGWNQWAVSGSFITLLYCAPGILRAGWSKAKLGKEAIPTQTHAGRSEATNCWVVAGLGSCWAPNWVAVGSCCLGNRMHCSV